MPARVLISGATGRMGQAVAGLVKASTDLRIVGGLDHTARQGAEAEALGYPVIETAAGAGPLLGEADMVIDFSAPEGLHALLTQQRAKLPGKALVVGTTGLAPEELQALDQLARESPLILSANYSIGVNLMLDVVANAARILPASQFDVEIVETHHRHKADAPSGTALLLGQVVAQAREQQLAAVRRDGRSGKTGERADGEIAFHALRGGEVVGEHRVLFLGAHERFEIAHGAADRGLFAEGALLAARWLLGKPAGRYTMRDVLGL